MFKCLIVGFSGLLLISSCAPYKNQFTCPPGSGIQCKSVSYVNEQINNGALNGVPKKRQAKIPVTLKQLPQLNTNNKELTAGAPLVRVPEKTLRIWLNGFMDGNDCYREEQYINKVIEKSHWEAKA